MTTHCLICDKEIKTFPCRVKKGQDKFCSRACKAVSQKNIPSKRRTGVVRRCLHCETEFYAPNWLSSRRGAKYCSYSCYWSSKLGKKPWNYEGITPINVSIRKTRRYRRWSRMVKERDDFTCQICGKRGNGEMHSDHIKPFSLYPELRFDLNNGRTLCLECHRNTETYGNRVLKVKYQQKCH